MYHDERYLPQTRKTFVLLFPVAQHFTTSGNCEVEGFSQLLTIPLRAWFEIGSELEGLSGTAIS